MSHQFDVRDLAEHTDEISSASVSSFSASDTSVTFSQNVQIDVDASIRDSRVSISLRSTPSVVKAPLVVRGALVQADFVDFSLNAMRLSF